MKRFYYELSEIRKIKKCKTCICFCEIVRNLSEALETIGDSRFQEMRNEVAEWMTDCKKAKLHDCLGCDPCLPVKPLTEFISVQSKNRK